MERHHRATPDTTFVSVPEERSAIATPPFRLGLFSSQGSKSFGKRFD